MRPAKRRPVTQSRTFGRNIVKPGPSRAIQPTVGYAAKTTHVAEEVLAACDDLGYFRHCRVFWVVVVFQRKSAGGVIRVVY